MSVFAATCQVEVVGALSDVLLGHAFWIMVPYLGARSAAGVTATSLRILPSAEPFVDESAKFNRAMIEMVRPVWNVDC